MSAICFNLGAHSSKRLSEPSPSRICIHLSLLLIRSQETLTCCPRTVVTLLDSVCASLYEPHIRRRPRRRRGLPPPTSHQVPSQANVPQRATARFLNTSLTPSSTPASLTSISLSATNATGSRTTSAPTTATPASPTTSKTNNQYFTKPLS